MGNLALPDLFGFGASECQALTPFNYHYPINAIFCFNFVEFMDSAVVF